MKDLACASIKRNQHVESKGRSMTHHYQMMYIPPPLKHSFAVNATAKLYPAISVLERGEKRKMVPCVSFIVLMHSCLCHIHFGFQTKS